jgi:hypothetical protein
MAVLQFSFPSAMDLMGIEQQLAPVDKKDNPAFDIFPEVNKDTPLLMWEQLDNFLGMMQPRGLGGRPNLVKAVGSKTYMMQPGYYGEFMTIEEREVTLSRRFASPNQPVDVSDLVVLRSRQLLHRQIQRQRWIAWQLMTKGVFVVTDPYGVLMHADSYAQRVFTATVPWATLATATPLADLRAVRPFARGFSISFGVRSRGFANTTTINNMMNNQNPNDLGGKRQANGATVNSLDGFNQILAANDCPQMVEWDGVWQDDTGTNQLDIPDNTVVIKGIRLDGAAIGNWVNTRCAMNPGMAPGPYYEVFQPFQQVPPTVEVHRGVNGGIALYFPSALLVMKV